MSTTGEGGGQPGYNYMPGCMCHSIWVRIYVEYCILVGTKVHETELQSI